MTIRWMINLKMTTTINSIMMKLVRGLREEFELNVSVSTSVRSIIKECES
jgi:hypothetical protein